MKFFSFQEEQEKGPPKEVFLNLQFVSRIEFVAATAIIFVHDERARRDPCTVKGQDDVKRLKSLMDSMIG